jgi:acyl carrier protein
MDRSTPVTLDQLRELLAENAMLKSDVSTIGEDTPLFGPEGLGLDSIDALQIIIAVEKNFGVAIGDASAAKDALQSLGVLQDWINRRLVVTE